MTTSDTTAVLSGPADPLLELLLPVLDDLAEAVDAVGPEDLRRPTPCEGFDVAALRAHAVGWVDFFAAALADPQARTDRPDPAAWTADDDADPAGTVRAAAAGLAASIRDGVNRRDAVRLSSSDLPGASAVGMVLGEYLVHGWDLRAALGLPWTPDPQACAVARTFLEGMILPEYRGGENGYFGAEVPVPDDAAEPDRLLGFAGRDPSWKP